MVEHIAMSVLATSAPLLAVYVIGAVLALLWRHRHRLSAWLLLAGCLILLITVVAHAFGFEYLMAQQMSSDGAGTSALEMAQARRWLGALSMIGNLSGTALLIAAALVGRGDRRSTAG